MSKKIALIIGGVGPERCIEGTTHFENTKSVLREIKKLKYKFRLFDFTEKNFILKILEYKPDVSYLTVYGRLGEDGSLQGLFNILKIRYTGSGVLSGSLGVNKQLCKKFLAKDVLSPRGIIVRNEKDIETNILKNNNLFFPLIVKPNNGGSSYGLFLVDDIKILKNQAKVILELYDKEVLIEEYIDGKEITVYVFKQVDKLIIPPIIDIQFRKGENIYSRKIKIDNIQRGSINCKIFSNHLRKEINETVSRLYLQLNCRGLVRFDLRIKENKIYFLEINIIPDVKNSGCLLKALNSVGWTYNDLIKYQISEATYD